MSRTFSVAKPSGWRAAAAPSTGSTVVRGELLVVGPRSKGFATNINVVSQEVPSGLDVDAVTKAGLAAAEKRGFHVREQPKPYEVAGGPGRGYAWVTTIQGTKLRQYQVLTLHGGRAYFATLSALSSNYERYLPTFRKLMTSWRWS